MEREREEEEEEEDKKMMAAPVEGLIGLHDADQIPSPFKNTTNPSRCYRAVGKSDRRTYRLAGGRLVLIGFPKADQCLSAFQKPKRR
jgi:hypothetical protein